MEQSRSKTYRTATPHVTDEETEAYKHVEEMEVL